MQLFMDIEDNFVEIALECLLALVINIIRVWIMVKLVNIIIIITTLVINSKEVGIN